MSASGIYFGEPEEVYHAPELGVLSSSAIKQLLRSPAHYRAWLLQEFDKNSTPAKIFGKALHCAVLEPERFAEVYAVLPEDAPRKPSKAQWGAKNPSDDSRLAMQWWERWNRQGKITLEREDHERILAMSASARAHPWAKLMLENGSAEVVIRWVDPETNLPCKLRADFVREIDSPRRLCIDVKALRDVSPKGFRRALDEYGFMIQQAHYSAGFKAIERPLAGFVLLAIENEPPYCAQPYMLDTKTEELGEWYRGRAAKILRESLDADRWPAYSDDILSIGAPPWAFREFEEASHE